MKYTTLFRAISVVAMLICWSGHSFAATYDAIAIDDDVGLKGGEAGFGVGEGNSAEEANHEALRACKKSGNDGCVLAVTYRHCGAYASSRQHSGTGKGDTESAAKREALDSCGSNGCRIVTSDCVDK